MNLEKLFYILKENGKITLEEIEEIGIKKHFIDELVSNKILRVCDDEYEIDSVDDLFLYGRYQLENKKLRIANTIFDCCYKCDNSNYYANLQLFYRSLIQRKNDDLFKYFDVVYTNLVDNDRENDANYYLLILGRLFDLPEKYQEKFNDLEENDILLTGDSEYVLYDDFIRKEIFSNSYYKVNQLFDEKYKDRDDLNFTENLEKELILKLLIKNRSFNKMLYRYLAEDKLDELKGVLDREDEKRFLSKSNQYVLKVLNQYMTIKNTKVIPKVSYNGEDTFEAINGNNYVLALRLLSKHQESLNIARDSFLVLILKKINELITSIKENKVLEETKYKALFDAVREMRSQAIYELTEKDYQSLDSKIRELINGRSAILLDPMPKEKRDAIHEYIKTYDDVVSFNIGKDEERRVVLRYKPYIEEYIDVFDVAKKARRCYQNHKYREAAECYETLLMLGTPREVTYGNYGLTLLKLHRKTEALDYLKIATIISKDKDGSLDYSEIIYNLENKITKENKKPKTVVHENEFYENNDKGLNPELINDLIGLTESGDISLVEACTKLNLSEEDINYIKLVYARDCYYLGNMSEGDLYLKQVERSKAKTKKIKKLFSEIQLGKKYYHNRLDENKSQLVLKKN